MPKKTTIGSLSIPCPNGCAPAGKFCNGYGAGCDLCQARISAYRATKKRKAAYRG